MLNSASFKGERVSGRPAAAGGGWRRLRTPTDGWWWLPAAADGGRRLWPRAKRPLAIDKRPLAIDRRLLARGSRSANPSRTRRRRSGHAATSLQPPAFSNAQPPTFKCPTSNPQMSNLQPPPPPSSNCADMQEMCRQLAIPLAARGQTEKMLRDALMVHPQVGGMGGWAGGVVGALVEV
jgi:hypothetical protein